MILVRTPFRMSFFGGGTDYPTYVKKYGGAVLSTTFDKYSYIYCRQLFPYHEYKYLISHSKTDKTNNIHDITHPVIRRILQNYASSPELSLKMTCDADLPFRSGLGSSSALVVGLLHVLEGLKKNPKNAHWLAKEAIHFEQNIMQETVGSQDQVAAAYGGLNIIQFHKDSSFSVHPLEISEQRKKELNSKLMLFFTGKCRFSTEVAEAQVKKIDENTEKLNRIRQMVDDAVDIVANGRKLYEFGELLHESWKQKRALASEISNDFIDSSYKVARDHGAIGGKLLGAGGGGFLLFYVEPENQQAVRNALPDLVHIPFNFEQGGSTILYNKALQR